MKKQLDPTLSVRVPQHTIDAIDKEAAARGLPRADYLRALFISAARFGDRWVIDAGDLPPELRDQYLDALMDNNGDLPPDLRALMGAPTKGQAQ